MTNNASRAFAMLGAFTMTAVLFISSFANPAAATVSQVLM